MKIGDTLPDIAEDSTPAWSVGVVMSSNELGMSPDEIRRADSSELERRKEWARGRMLGAGAHFVVDALSDINGVRRDRRAAQKGRETQTAPVHTVCGCERSAACSISFAVPVAGNGRGE